MALHSYAHQIIAWVEKSAANIKADAGRQADAARERITDSRAKLRQHYDDLCFQADMRPSSNPSTRFQSDFSNAEDVEMS